MMGKKKIYDFAVYGLNPAKNKKKIIGSIRATSKENAIKRLKMSGSVLDTPEGSKWPRFNVEKKR